MINSKIKKIAKWIGYPIFAIVCFAMFTLWTFPFDKMKGKMQDQFSKQFNMNVEMDTISSSFPFGIKATNVTLASTAKAVNPLLPLSVKEISITPGFISTMLGEPNFNLDAKLFGGRINADITANTAEKKYAIKMDIDGFDCTKIPYFKNAYKDFPMEGIIDVETDLTLNMKKIKESQGFVELQISKGSMGPGKLTFELPKVRTGTLESRFVINKGKLEVETFTQQSPDMQSNMRGYITLSKNLQYSNVNLDYRFKLSDDLIKKHDVFQLALSAIKNAEGSDKFFYHTITGPISKAKALPSKSAQYKFRDSKKGKKKDKVKKATSSRKKPAAKKSRSNIKSRKKSNNKKSPKVTNTRPPRTPKKRPVAKRPKPAKRPRAVLPSDTKARNRIDPPPEDEPEEEDDLIEEDEEEEEVEEDEEKEEDEEEEEEDDEETDENKDEDTPAEEQDEPEEN